MRQSKSLSETVVVFDLDDTLYKEADYVVSGLRAVCAAIESIYGRDISRALVARKEAGEKDLLGVACELATLAPAVKDSLLWVYRTHRPAIALDESTRQVLAHLEANCRQVAVLTDGRSITQRLKLRALGLGYMPAYISEEHGSEKPNDLRFRRIMKDFPAASYVYVGDNPKKDFIAPKALGWRTIGLKGDASNVHSQEFEGQPESSRPDRWVDRLDDLLKEWG